MKRSKQETSNGGKCLQIFYFLLVILHGREADPADLLPLLVDDTERHQNIQGVIDAPSNVFLVR